MLYLYYKKYVELHGQYIRTQTAKDYEYIIHRFIIPTIGTLKMKEVVADDILEALLSAPSQDPPYIHYTLDYVLKKKSTETDKVAIKRLL